MRRGWMVLLMVMAWGCDDGWQRRADVEVGEPRLCRYPEPLLAAEYTRLEADRPLEETAEGAAEGETTSEAVEAAEPAVEAAEPAVEAAEPPEREEPAREEAGCVDLNAATAEGLTALPGVGPGRAARIVALRPFKRARDITRVKGIGERTYAKMAPRLCPVE